MHGMVLDLGKKKMSKSQGNIVAPSEVISKYGRDYLRFYLAKEFSGEDMEFDWDAFKDIGRFFNTLWNSINYGATYLDIGLAKSGKIEPKKLEPEDRWIISKLNSLERDVLREYNNYNYSKAAQLIEYFVLEEFSRTYIKLIRDRAKGKTRKALSATFSHVTGALLRLLAPITPHFSDYVYAHFKAKGMEESIHLEALPQPNEKHIDVKLEEEMGIAKQLIQEALNIREAEQLRLRWPLKELVFVSKEKKFRDTQEIIAGSANVKKFTQTAKEPKGNYASKEFAGGKIFLDKEAGAELKEEWELMELRRRIQDARKQAKLSPSQVVGLELACSDGKFLKKYKKQIEQETGTKIVAGKGQMEKVLEREFYIKLGP